MLKTLPWPAHPLPMASAPSHACSVIFAHGVDAEWTGTKDSTKNEFGLQDC